MAMDNATAHNAAEYDRKIQQVIPFYQTIHEQTREIVATVVPEPECWLDTGCGTGALVAGALPMFPRTRFFLADPSEAMLAQARARLGAERRVTILAAAGSAELPDLTPRPQAITAVLCHHYLPPDGRRAALARCHALLQDGGVLVSFENVVRDTPEGSRIGLQRWRYWQLAQGRSVEEVQAQLARFGHEVLPVRIDENLSLLRAVGFRTVEMLWHAHMQAGFYAIR